MPSAQSAVVIFRRSRDASRSRETFSEQSCAQLAFSASWLSNLRRVPQRFSSEKQIASCAALGQKLPLIPNLHHS
jgi:hypothetical protein